MKRPSDISWRGLWRAIRRGLVAHACILLAVVAMFALGVPLWAAAAAGAVMTAYWLGSKR